MVLGTYMVACGNSIVGVTTMIWESYGRHPQDKLEFKVCSLTKNLGRI